MKISSQAVTRTAAEGTNGAVAAARLQSAEAGMEMLEQGGNAVDAAVAAGFVAGVVEPMETTIAGSGFMLVHTGDGEVHSVEFAPRAPAAATDTMYKVDTSRALDRGLGVSVVEGDENLQGIKAAGIPASLTGLIKAHGRFGRLPLATVLQPAIRAAHDGFEADSYFALEVVANLAALRKDPGAAAAFLSGGDPFAVPHLGETSLGQPTMVRQKQLGRTLELLAAQGAEAFSAGEVGDRLMETVHELGGIIARDDLRNESTFIARARRMEFRGHDVWGPVSPCGTLTQHQILKIWTALYPEGGPNEDTPQRLEHLAAASWHAFADRYHWLGDPDFVPVPEAGLLDERYIGNIARAIKAGASAPRAKPGQGAPWDLFAGVAAHDPWEFEARSESRPSWRPEGATAPTAGTTHISVIDRSGMAVSLTHTAANHFGSKVLCPRTGLLMDGAMGWFNAHRHAANSIAGRKRPLANMAPMLLTRNGKATAAIGAPGGRRIINAVLQLALNLVERKMDAAGAVHAPRIDASGSTLLASERLRDVVSKIDAKEYPSVLVKEQHIPFNYELARPVVVTRTEDGRLQAATDQFAKGFALAN
ncbi:gamma-glutamyltransferase [Bradyrhizobium sp. LHD-71]|uniref:gamma-glutamyltransferase family protein n=1 Tax=Bradyrhizobium sp. LHD-71 TaxID=3072141 RepID=UPI00280D34FB|nr:gamma-glutamyltransferase [Bradyrhizobium sp. LHD-71]MDQ8730863.1 gamma-glutamyltransferase [Bradyrhizobium sp. LHD-71]